MRTMGMLLGLFVLGLGGLKGEEAERPSPRDNRIYFAGNPWPEGHPVKEFRWTSEVREGLLWFHLHLESEDYHSERRIGDFDAPSATSSWEEPSVWGNYHSCKISSTSWHDGGFLVGPVEDFRIENLDGREFLLDPSPDFSSDSVWEDLAFHIYLLGHDAVANHRIHFKRVGESDTFDIQWRGSIALVYSGDYDFDHRFSVRMTGVPMPKINAQP